MPKAVFPPTPAPSMDIVGKDDAFQASLKDKASFTLPPPAIAPAPLHDARDDDEACLQTRTGSQYSLPPPPTRTRKIIQMTPKVDLRGETADSCVETSAAKIRHPAARSSPATRKATGKKQPSSTSQDGKRIARKTAHSVIERRRRSKMNEEFGVLKNMIPACSNQEMHKLAILQASIEYLRYLEQCVTDLKTANGTRLNVFTHRSPPAVQPSTPPEHDPQARDEDDIDVDDEEDSDVDMIGAPGLPVLHTKNHAQTSAYTSPHSTATSPALDACQYQVSTSYTSPLSELPSPAIESGPSAGGRDPRHNTCSTSTSPKIPSNSSKEADEQATEALLMLNKDRRNTNTSSNSSTGRGMSVKDLLSSQSFGKTIDT